MHQQVLAKMNGDRPYFEARGAWKDAYFKARDEWKKVNGYIDYDGPLKLANLFHVWEKIVDCKQGVILECDSRTLHEMVKSAVTCVKAKPVNMIK